MSKLFCCFSVQSKTKKDKVENFEFADILASRNRSPLAKSSPRHPKKIHDSVWVWIGVSCSCYRYPRLSPSTGHQIFHCWVTERRLRWRNAPETWLVNDFPNIASYVSTIFPQSSCAMSTVKLELAEFWVPGKMMFVILFSEISFYFLSILFVPSHNHILVVSPACDHIQF